MKKVYSMKLTKKELLDKARKEGHSKDFIKVLSLELFNEDEYLNNDVLVSLEDVESWLDVQTNRPTFSTYHYD